MKIQILVSKNDFPFYKETILVLKAFLSSRRIPHWIISSPEMIDSELDTRVIVFGIHSFNFSEINLIPGKKMIGIQTEQLPQESFEERFTWDNWLKVEKNLQYFSNIIDIYEGNILFLQKQGYKANLLKLGYHEYFEFKDLPQPYKYDICFLGALSPRREKILSDLKSLGYKITPNIAWGKERNDYINQSKICLNIHYSESDFFEVFRIEQLFLSNQKFVISESSKFNRNYINGRHLKLCNYEEIVDNCRLFLKNKKEMEKIANVGYTFIKKNNHFSVHLEQLFNILLIKTS